MVASVVSSHDVHTPGSIKKCGRVGDQEIHLQKTRAEKKAESVDTPIVYTDHNINELPPPVTF